MAVISNQQALSRLNALASGGSAALDLYDQAQQRVGQAQQAALNQALGAAHANIPGMVSAGERANLEGIVSHYTEPYANDAASARNLAGQQVGYDQTAADTYLNQQRSKLAEAQREAQLNMGLQAQKLSNPLLALSQTDRNALIEGAARVLQGQVQQQQQTNRQNEVQSQIDQYKADKAGISRAKSVLDAIKSGNWTVDSKAQQRTGAPLLQTMVQNAIQGSNRADQAKAALAQAMANSRQLNAQFPDANLDLNQFKRLAAPVFKMPQLLAEGLYPTTPEYLAQQAKNANAPQALARQQLADQYSAATTEQKLADMQNYGALSDALGGIDPTAAKSIARSARLAPDRATAVASDAPFQNANQAVESMFSGGGVDQSGNPLTWKDVVQRLSGEIDPQALSLVEALWASKWTQAYG